MRCCRVGRATPPGREVPWYRRSASTSVGTSHTCRHDGTDRAALRRRWRDVGRGERAWWWPRPATTVHRCPEIVGCLSRWAPRPRRQTAAICRARATRSEEHRAVPSSTMVYVRLTHEVARAKSCSPVCAAGVQRHHLQEDPSCSSMGRSSGRTRAEIAGRIEIPVEIDEEQRGRVEAPLRLGVNVVRGGNRRRLSACPGRAR